MYVCVYLSMYLSSNLSTYHLGVRIFGLDMFLYICFCLKLHVELTEVGGILSGFMGENENTLRSK